MSHWFKLVCVLILIFLVSDAVLCRPGQSEEWIEPPQTNKCRNCDDKVIEVCQRCAKQTKSPIVYPMCCANEEDVYTWCDRFINYGKKSKRSLSWFRFERNEIN